MHKISSNPKTKYHPIDWLVLCNHYNKEMRESKFFYCHTVVMAHYVKEIGKKDHKILIQLPQKNNWHLLSDDVLKISHVYTLYTKSQELKIFSCSSVNRLVVCNAFQKDYDHIGRITPYKYWIWIFFKNIRKWNGYVITKICPFNKFFRNAKLWRYGNITWEYSDHTFIGSKWPFISWMHMDLYLSWKLRKPVIFPPI